MRKKSSILRSTQTAGWVVCLVLGLVFISWAAVQAPVRLDDRLVVENWPVVDDGAHNAFTDLIYWKNNFYLVFRSAPNHVSHQSKLVILRSANARTWEKLTELRAAGEDIRDPKFAIIGEQLFLYALKNVSFLAQPYATIFSTSADGQTWQPWQDVGPAGWLFWRPRSFDGKTWYVPAYSTWHHQTRLFQSEDGKQWHDVSMIYSSEPQSEVDITFTGDGSLMGVIRMDGQAHQAASTLIVSASYPYQAWTSARSSVTRLDGPGLFSYQGLVFAVGRSEPEGGILFDARGGLFNKKRSSLFQVTTADLHPLTDFPSAGDTSYAGIVIRGDEGFVSYYTNDIQQDPPWILGQFLPTSIRIARLNLLNLKRATLPLP